LKGWGNILYLQKIINPMERIYLDLFLSGITYVIITYLAFQLMKRRKVDRNGNDDESGGLENETPKITLRPGVVWLDSPLLTQDTQEKITA